MSTAADRPAGRPTLPPPTGQPIRSDPPTDTSDRSKDDGRLRLTGGGWWRRNRKAALALLILVPLTGGLIIGNSRRKMRPRNATEPIVVDADQPAAVGEATIGPIAASFRSEPGPAPNSRVLSVEIAVDGANLNACEITLRETAGERREWSDALLALPDTDSFAARSCVSSDTPYSIENDFLIPADADGPFSVDVRVAELQPYFLRFPIRPTQ